jgi:benzoyl-CoA reductase/2-hydroxyglutaryl-CoA dehydratase subunit BcrC/BadD/HgdB
MFRSDSCTSPDRWRPLASAGAPTADDDRYSALARDILATGMCPRRSTAERRDHLIRRIDESRPSSIVYARQSFCDPGAYDALLVAQLAEERGLPYLEIEVGFPFEASGPLRTRVEAFLEAQLLDDDLLDDLIGTDDFETGGQDNGLDEED